MTSRDHPDPMDEAKVYLAYGRNDEAIKILEQAIREAPARADCKTLLEQIRSTKNSPHTAPQPLDTAAHGHSPTSQAASGANEIPGKSAEPRRKGLTEDKVVAVIEHRLRDSDQRLENDPARTKGGLSKPRRFYVLPRVHVPIVTALLFAFGGIILEETLGTRFIFSAENQYRLAMPWIVGVLTPLFAWLIFRAERVNHDLSDRFPTWWVRWLVMFPFMAVLTSVFVAWAPPGWSALFGRALGSSAEQLEATVVDVSRPYTHGCSQNAEIKLKGNTKLICLADVLVGQVPNSEDTVTVVGSRSIFGTYIEEIRVK